MTLAVNIAQGGSNNVTFRNRIINGAMVISQRKTTFSDPANGEYTLDRWAANVSTTGKLSVQQSSTAPAGFTNSLLVTSSSAYSVGSSDYFNISQYIEGFNAADLGWGAAGAKTITLSFQVYSSLTGTFGGSLENVNNDRSYPFTYTISSANTWTSISVTVAGDTSGTWNKTNDRGISVRFGLGVGSTYSGAAGAWAGADYRSATGATSVVGTNGATFYITGVQLEVGSAASPFENRSYTTELQLCQRYYYVNASGAADLVMCAGYYLTSSNAGGIIPYPVTMRTTPSLVSTSGTNYYKTSTDDLFNSLSNAYGTNQTMLVFNNTETSGTAGYSIHIRTNSASASVAFSAEL